MRDIKFRAWDDKSKKMWEPEVICIKDGKVKAGLVMTPAQAKKGVKEGWFYDNPLMQYTGLKDKNGKEIYEGDIIDYGYYSKEDDTEDLSRPMRFVAKWSQEDSGFVANGRLMTRYQYYAFPVIGNIYENPDLLEEKKGE